MDIERLKELQIAKQTLLLNKAAAEHDGGFDKGDKEFIDAVEIAVVLIDAEIARQSVTDEAVRVNSESVRGIINSGEYLATLNDANLADLVILTNEVQNYISESLVALQQMKVKPSVTGEAVKAVTALLDIIIDRVGENKDCGYHLHISDIKTIRSALQAYRAEPCEIIHHDPEFAIGECGACGYEIDPDYGWNHCPDCGRKLKGG